LSNQLTNWPHQLQAMEWQIIIMRQQLLYP
jgi:hypothetical protein